MAQKVKRVGIERKSRCLYFVDADGDVACVNQVGGGGRRKVKRVGVRKQSGYLYFVDADGDVSRSKMARR